jgi:hypothetical protein
MMFWGEDGYARFKNGGGRSAEIPDEAAGVERSDAGALSLRLEKCWKHGDLAAGADGDRS